MLDDKGILYKSQPPYLPEPLGYPPEPSDTNGPTAQDASALWQMQRVCSSGGNMGGAVHSFVGGKPGRAGKIG